MTTYATKLKKYLDLDFRGVEPKDAARWRTAIVNIVSSMPSSELRHIPPIRIHKTLLGAMAGTFDNDSDTVDDMARDYYDSNIWAFAYLLEGERKVAGGVCEHGKKIVLASSVGLKKSMTIPPEVSIFHEMGHFYMQTCRKIEMTCCNERDTEYECDRFAMMAYLRMLQMRPNYTPIVVTNNTLSFTDSLRRKALACMKSGLKGNRLRDELYRRADEFMKEMKWKEIYAKIYDRPPLASS